MHRGAVAIPVRACQNFSRSFDLYPGSTNGVLLVSPPIFVRCLETPLLSIYVALKFGRDT